MATAGGSAATAQNGARRDTHERTSKGRQARQLETGQRRDRRSRSHTSQRLGDDLELRAATRPLGATLRPAHALASTWCSWNACVIFAKLLRAV
jgi:hypothetical protein